MSEQISFESQIDKCVYLDLKILLLVLFCCMFCSCMVYSLSPIEQLKNISFKPTTKFQSEDKYKESQLIDYRTIVLTSDTTLLTGHATRYIYNENEDEYTRLEIYCNLNILNGSIYTETVNDNYKVYIVNPKTESKQFVDVLGRSYDGYYKLKTIGKNIHPDYIGILITYSRDSTEEVVLYGEFN